MYTVVTNNQLPPLVSCGQLGMLLHTAHVPGPRQGRSHPQEGDSCRDTGTGRHGHEPWPSPPPPGPQPLSSA